MKEQELGSKDARTALGTETCAKTIEALLAYAEGMGVEKRLRMRSNIEGNLAGVLTAIERKKERRELDEMVVQRHSLPKPTSGE